MYVIRSPDTKKKERKNWKGPVISNCDVLLDRLLWMGVWI